MTLSPEMLAVRKRLHESFPFYSENALKIRSKDGDIVPLKLKPAQKILMDAIENQLASEGKIRIVILKARQQGLSTMVGGYMYFRTSQNKARRSMVVTHHSDSSRALFDMTRRFHDNCPEILKPSTKYSSRKELAFDVLDSSFIVGTAGAETLGRGETITDLHASELAFYPASTAREVFNGLLQAVPNKPGTSIFVESTANGVSGLFADLWRGACEGTNGFVPVFIPWFMDPEYREPISKPLEHTPEEFDLIKLYGLDDEQLQYRRRKIATNGIDLWNQEYPATPSDAFLTTGRPVFPPEKVQKMLNEAKAPIARLALEGDKWMPHVRGELQCYYPHEEGEVYYIGSDVAFGTRGGDFSVATVLDSKKRVVAVYRSHVHPDYFGDVLFHLGTFYNEAKIIVEANNHGLTTLTRLSKYLYYPNTFTEESYDKITDTYSERLGFMTTAKSKPLVIDKLRAALREDELEIHHRETLQEMLTYILEDNGSTNAEAGCHDDTVMALALANFIHEGRFTPIANLESWYVEAL